MTVETPIPKPGDTIAGRYEIVEVIGRGGFGIVFKAVQLGIGRPVALKILISSAALVDPVVVERFRREAVLASALKHPNTVTLFDYGQTERGLFYIAMEYVEGVGLKKLTKASGCGMPVELAVHVARQILSSLTEAHRLGIVHRDLKPDNIMLCTIGDDEHFVQILDFGIAKVVENEALSMDQITADGKMFGTPRYMSPEQIRCEEVTAASDVYSFGLILYELLTGRPAVDGESTVDIVMKQVSGPAPKLPGNLGIPKGLNRLVNRCLIKKPEQRYPSAQEVLEELKVLFPSGSTGELSGPVGPFVRRPRARGLVFAAAVVGLLALTVGAFALLQNDLNGSGSSRATTSEKSGTSESGDIPGESESRAPGMAHAESEKPCPNGDCGDGDGGPAQVAVHVTSQPEGARVHHGDALLGVTPVDLSFPYSQAAVTLRFEKDGFVEVERAVALTGDGETPLECTVSLDPIEGDDSEAGRSKREEKRKKKGSEAKAEEVESAQEETTAPSDETTDEPGGTDKQEPKEREKPKFERF